MLSEFKIASDIKDLKCFIAMLEFRIKKQELLLDRISCGKWKSAELEKKYLRALAMSDLKLLTKMKIDSEKELPILLEQLETNYPEVGGGA